VADASVVAAPTRRQFPVSRQDDRALSRGRTGESLNDIPCLVHVFPSFGTGGTELRITRIINGLRFRARHAILALDGCFEAAGQFAPDIEYALVPPPRLGRVPRVLRLRQRLTASRPDLLLTYNWGAIEAVAAARLGGEFPIIHNESGFGLEEATSRKRRRRWVRRLLLPGIESTIVNSRTLHEIATSEFGVPRRKIRLIRNGIDVGRFAPGRNPDLRASWGATHDTVLFGFVGKHRKEKNLGMLIQAFASAGIANAKLIIVGDGPCRLEAAAAATRLGIDNRVVFTGELPDVNPCLRAIDVFTMSSATEQSPNALLEAMACGLPAIATDVGDISEMLGAKCGPELVRPDHVDGLTESIRTLAQSSTLRRELGVKNRARAIEYFSLDRMVAEFTAAYESALQRSAPAG